MASELLLQNTHLLAIEIHPITLGVSIAIVTLIILLLLSGMLSGSEVAFFSLTPTDISKLEKKVRNNRHILLLIKDPETLLATILIGNNFVNVAIVILSAFISKTLFSFGDVWFQFIIETIGITGLILFFGEIFPKVYASRFTFKFAESMAYPLIILKNLFFPFSYLLVRSSSFVNKRIARKQNSISLDDISQALQITSKEIKEEKDILESIMKFGNINAAEISTARVNVVDIDYTDSFSKVLNIIIESGYSRIPVFENTPDNVKGVLYVKDVVPYLEENDNFKWQSLIREPYFIPETKKLNDLLEEFKRNKIHMAIVVDEYGGTSGIVTLEDILEEIIGEIPDEQDDDESFFTREPDGSIIFEGKTLLNDFHKITEIDENYFDDVKGEAETLAGLMLELRGEIPDKNKEIIHKQYVFTILAVDSRKIIQIKFEEKKSNRTK